MDIRLRSAMMNLQTTLANANDRLEKLQKKNNRLINVGQKCYKQAVNATPTLADNPVWVTFRELLDIPLGAVDPVNVDPPDDSVEATTAVAQAVGAVNNVTAFSAIPQEKRAELLEQLELALTNARAHLNLNEVPQ
jgi:hypothetical protein